ncbi:MAG TPA: SDR family oxidoreductase [Actinomycetota bacterium]|nr:SDR family oxidoreductase [Actinomycetota bacterium]
MSIAQLLSRFDGVLQDRSAVVTGAGSGIGRAVSIAFARAGADVALMGRRQERLEETANEVRAAGRNAVVLPIDVRDDHAVRDAVASSSEAIGPADIAVANAGANGWGDVDEQTASLLRDALAVNIEGVANLVRATVPAMRERGFGKVIVVASDNGRRPEAGGSAYVASKFGAVGLSLSVAQELYASGIGVHVLEPGCVDTDWYPPGEDAPRDRMLSADDVAYVALFLASLPSSIVVEEVMMLPRGLLVTPW